MKQNDELLSRRDFISLIFGWICFFLTGLGTLYGMFRSFIANVSYEESSVFKIGKPEDFPLNSTNYLDNKKIFVFHTKDGFRVVSSVCTHLGCIVNRTQEGNFFCPCHGSEFDSNGNVIAGPAPRALEWFYINLTKDGYLQVNTKRIVREDEYIKI